MHKGGGESKGERRTGEGEKSVEMRKGEITPSPENGVWAMSPCCLLDHRGLWAMFPVSWSSILTAESAKGSSGTNRRLGEWRGSENPRPSGASRGTGRAEGQSLTGITLAPAAEGRGGDPRKVTSIWILRHPWAAEEDTDKAA